MSYLPPMVQILLLALTAAAAIFDLRSRRIPNWLVLTGVLAGIGVNIYLTGLAGAGTSLLGMGLALLIYFPLFLLRAMGAGDAKLMAAVGSLTGAANWLGIMILTAIMGGILAAVAVLAKGRVGRTVGNLKLMLISLRMGQAPHQVSPELDVGSERALRLPHAVAILLGSVTFLVVAAIWAPR